MPHLLESLGEGLGMILVTIELGGRKQCDEFELGVRSKIALVAPSRQGLAGYQSRGAL